MSNRVGVAVAVLLAGAFVLRAEDKFYQVDLVPSGKVIARDLPVTKGTMVVFHEYPSGTLVSMPRSSVKKVAQIAPANAQQTNLATEVIPIGNLAMQGGSSQAGPQNARTVAAAKAPQLGQGFYGNVVPGTSQAMPNSANDNVVGKDWAYGPGNAVVSSPGGVPMMPSATSGSNPPQ